MLFNIRKRAFWGLLLAVLFLVSFFISARYFSQRPRVRLGEHVIFCNPRARINPKKLYHLKLWDYEWPVNQKQGGYKAFLQKAVADFRKVYPNIEVEITLLDLLKGPQQFTQALQSGLAPDVYCSAFTIPPFDYQRQIPVGFYLKKEEMEAYYPSLLNLTLRHDIVCYFPRWTTPGIWAGNRQLLEKAGLSPVQLQQQGWSLSTFWDTASKTPPGVFLLVGNPAYNGFFTQLAGGFTASKSGTFQLNGLKTGSTRVNYTIDQLAGLITRRKIPPDFDSNMMGHFLAGKSMFLAGVRPVLFRFLKERATANQSAWDPVLLPPPSPLWPKQLLLVENSVIGVYRNKFTRGNDQLTAAVKLGQFLSMYRNVTPYQEMMAIPAVKANARLWKMKLEGLGAGCSFLMNLIEKASLIDLGTAPDYQETVYPVLRDFLAGKITKEIAAARLISEKALIPGPK
ncbi:MAG: extracellular solute-binding protein [Firmicutes bacterium]|nr:extracellular solute-binding protein [Bacillota bacterium]